MEKCVSWRASSSLASVGYLQAISSEWRWALNADGNVAWWARRVRQQLCACANESTSASATRAVQPLARWVNSTVQLVLLRWRRLSHLSCALAGIDFFPKMHLRYYGKPSRSKFGIVLQWLSITLMSICACMARPHWEQWTDATKSCLTAAKKTEIVCANYFRSIRHVKHVCTHCRRSFCGHRRRTVITTRHTVRDFSAES